MSKEGFSIKCKKCGKEDIFRDEGYWYNRELDKSEIKITVDIDWRYSEGDIRCECGNTIEI